MTDAGYPHVPEDYAAGDKSISFSVRDWIQQIGRAVNSLRDGKINARGTVTLNTSGTTTTLNDLRIGPNSVVVLVPTNDAAAGETGTWAEAGDQTATIHHVENSNARTFKYAVLG